MENNQIPKIEFRQISSLEKIRSEQEGLDAKAIEKPILLKGEEFSYQLYINFEKNDFTWFKVSVESDLDVKVYDVKNANMDFPTYENPDDYYITTEPGLMPDILMPIEEQKNWISGRGFNVLWVKINVQQYPFSRTAYCLSKSPVRTNTECSRYPILSSRPSE